MSQPFNDFGSKSLSSLFERYLDCTLSEAIGKTIVVKCPVRLTSIVLLKGISILSQIAYWSSSVQIWAILSITTVITYKRLPIRSVIFSEAIIIYRLSNKKHTRVGVFFLLELVERKPVGVRVDKSNTHVVSLTNETCCCSEDYVFNI